MSFSCVPCDASRVSKRPSIGNPWIDESRAPLYQLAFPPDPTDAVLLEMCAARERWAEVAKFPVAWVVDTANLGGATARQRRILGDHLERFEPHDLAWNQGSAIIVPNAVLRGIVTAVFWLKSPRFPHESFRTKAEAVAWATARLEGSPRASAV